MRRHGIVICLFMMTIAASAWAAAQEQNAAVKAASRAIADSGASAGGPPLVKQGAAARIEGEKRFKANCGRCHMAPNKFPPRMTATIVRHMRVRASITDDDARLILDYMNQ